MKEIMNNNNNHISIIVYHVVGFLRYVNSVTFVDVDHS